DAFAIVFAQILRDLAGVVLRFVERNADFSARRGDRAADKAGDAPVNVEEVDLLEAEQIAVEIPPLVHVAAKDVVRQVVEIIEADALGFRIAFAKPLELAIIGRALRAISVYEIEQ